MLKVPSSDIAISIIMPTYNGSRHISKAIESCLQQTIANFELIIVDDGSTDNTHNIIEAYRKNDSRVKIIKNERNMQLPASLNIGSDLAKGRYLTWTSDDNIYAPSALEVLLHAIEAAGADIAFASYTMMDEAGEPLSTYSHPVEGLLFNCVIGPCFLYKREVHEKLGGYDTSKFRAEDMDFWLRAVVHFKVTHVDRVDLYFYRLHTQSLSSQIFTDNDVYNAHKRNYEKTFELFFADGLSTHLSAEELTDYVNIIFFDKEYASIKTSKKLQEVMIRYIALFDKLKELDWKRVGFNGQIVVHILNERRAYIVRLVIDNILFENEMLGKKNPKLAKNFTKDISWYYKEYEVLPQWYKKVGHLLKALHGNKSWSAIIRKDNK